MNLLSAPALSAPALAATLATLALLPGVPAAISAMPLNHATVIDTGFESGRPPDAVATHLTTAPDTTRAHTGTTSLKMTSTKKGSWGNLTFNLDGKLDFTANHELSVWVYTEASGTRFSAYISADDGSGEPYTVAHALGAIEPGKWCRLTGTVCADYWRKNDRDFKLIVRARGACWIDDLAFTAGVPSETPAQVWPALETALHTAAAQRATPLAPGGTLTLDARHAALVPDTARLQILLPAATATATATATNTTTVTAAAVATTTLTTTPATGAAAPPIQNPKSKIQNPLVPAEGLLVFAIDATDDLDLTGTLELHHIAPLAPSPPSAPAPAPATNAPAPPATPASPDGAAAPPIQNPKSKIQNPLGLQPGLRVAVLSDDTVIAAPGVKSLAPWRAAPGVGNRPGPTPDIQGARPPPTIPLNTWRMTKGRHHITIAGPHMRPGGAFVKLEIRAAPRPAEKPLCTFAFLSDTHLGFGRITKAHAKINASTAAQLEATLLRLKREGAAFAILGGDMTDNGRRSQFEDLARAIKNAGLPVYGCIGNHDTFRDSRADIAEILAPLFPEGAANTDYAFTRPPLRFIVLDGSHWRNKDTPIQPHRIPGRAEQNTYRENMHDWLRATLAEDTVTPTIVISHYHFYLPRGVSPVTGYNLGKSALNTALMTILDAAPNVIATMSGHHHYNTVGKWHGITTLQNPAFATWPNAYRVCRVYADRLEWEVRQIPNRGLIRESANPSMKLLWPLSTHDNDISGVIPLAPRTPAPTP